MGKVILWAMVCWSCNSEFKVSLDGYESGATITQKVGEFFSLKVNTEGDTGTWVPELRIMITDGDDDAIGYALMSWGRSGRYVEYVDNDITGLFLTKDLPTDAQLKIEWAGASEFYDIKSTPGRYMFSTPPEFITRESQPVQLQWNLSYNAKLQAGDHITWYVVSDHGGVSNLKEHTLDAATNKVRIIVEEEDTTHQEDEESCHIFAAKITRAGENVAVNAASVLGLGRPDCEF